MSTPLTPRQAVATAIWRTKRKRANPARTSLMAFNREMYPGYIAGEHITRLIAALEAVERGEITRLIVTMPPRHSKSFNVSENFPAWYLGRNPDKRIIASSHTAQLSYTFSRRVRNKVQHPGWPFPEVQVAGDKGGVVAWDIARHRGGYLSVGVGGSPTGHGADLIIIDDPIRSAADADSETIREGLWEWYQGTLRTRLQPGGSIILTACMTGDTVVTMANGSAKALRDIEVGDLVATYEDGRIATSRIANWINHGTDYVYEIRMKSGKIVRGNERHPFLVKRGETAEWVRLRDLNPGDCLTRCEVIPATGGNGEASPVPPMAAKNPLGARDIAPSTIKRCDGLAAIGHHRSITSHDETHNSNVATESLLMSTTPCLPHKMDAVPSVASNLIQEPARVRPTARTGGSLSITATTQARFADSSVTSATSPSGTATLLTSCSGPLSTFAITPDEIVDIVPAGSEDVFDIEVERTENFIADGVVSHNTRWHHDDLTGRLLAEMEHGGEQWVHLHMPAVNGQDEPLWPEYWPAESLEKIRQSVGSRVWQSQYMGEPTPAEGGILKRHWFGSYAAIPPSAFLTIQSWDTAFKTGDTHDYSVCSTISDGMTGTHLRDVYRDRLEYPDLKRAILRQAERFRPSAILIEDKASGQSLIQDLRRETSLPIIAIPVPSTKDWKIQRVNEIAPYVESGRVLLPIAATWLDDVLHELTAFPLATHDDITDSVAQGIRWLLNRANAGGGTASWLPDADDDEEDPRAW